MNDGCVIKNYSKNLFYNYLGSRIAVEESREEKTDPDKKTDPDAAATGSGI